MRTALKTQAMMPTKSCGDPPVPISHLYTRAAEEGSANAEGRMRTFVKDEDDVGCIHHSN